MNPADPPDGLRLRATTRADGNLALHTVTADAAATAEAGHNRAAVLAPWNLAPDDLVTAEQVHGAGVATVGRPEAGGPARAGADALVTRIPDVALMILGADCPLVCLYDAAQPAVALAHAGWRGLAAGVLEATLDALAPADTTKIRAWLSACAGPCCYEVGEEVASRFPPEVVVRAAGRRPHLDLPLAVALSLPVPPTPLGGCTICGDTHFSHRRTGTPSRHALIASLTS